MCTILHYQGLLGLQRKIKNLCFPLLGKNSVSIFSDIFSLFVDLMFFCIRSKCPKIVASDFGIFASINLAVRPGHVAKFPFFTAFIKSDLTEMKHVACEKLLTLLVI